MVEPKIQIVVMSILLSLGLLLPQDAPSHRLPPSAPLPGGVWRAWLDSPGGELAFQLELAADDTDLRAWLVNDRDRTPASSTIVSGDTVELAWTDFDSVLRAKIGGGGMTLDGTWEKQRDRSTREKLGFHARFGLDAGQVPAMPLLSINQPNVVGAHTPSNRENQPVSGRYAVQFENAKDPAVALLEEEDVGGRVRGTFLTVLGDYRFLSGQRTGNELMLSCFDGAHAFLFRAQVNGDSLLNGRFWSSDGAPEAWSAKRDGAAALPDPYQLTRQKTDTLGDLAFPDLFGQTQRLADKELRGEACVVLIFGSWCPNCHDATDALKQLEARFGAQGMRVIGLAFELTDDAARNRRVLSAYAQRHEVTWPILLAGPADKKLAARALPFLDKVVAYPTAVFVDRTGKIQGIYTGFTGPAGGREHVDLVAQWRTRIASML